MHASGVRLDTIVERANGSRETLIDVPYDSTNRITYETDMVLKPGDSPVTTCHFQNDTDRLIKEAELAVMSKRGWRCTAYGPAHSACVSPSDPRPNLGP